MLLLNNKVRLMGKVYNNEEGIDFDDTYKSLVKLEVSC